jgi:putative ABC transport system permease protein
VLGAVLAEALVVGLVGSALGLGLGLLLALAIRALFEALGIGLPSGDLVVAARTPIVALVVGTLITVLASVVPAIRGTRVAPVEALRDVSAPPSPTSSRIRLGLGLLLLVLGVGSLVLGLFGSGGLAAIGPGSALVILAVALLSSLVAGPIASALGAPVSALRGLPGELARENAVRNPRRTASTASALMIGVGLVSFVLIVAASLQASIDKIIADQFRAELQVTAVDFTGLPDGALDALDDVDGVVAASPQSVATIGVDGDARGALVLDPATIGETYAIEVSEGDLARLGEGTIALGTDFAAAEDLGVGDALEVQLSPTGEPAPFEVVAIYDPASIGDGNPVAVDYGAYRDAVPDVRAFLVSVALEEGADVADVRTSIDAALADFPAVEVQDLDEIRAEIATQTNQLLGGIFALLFLSVFIALFGIVNTLNLSILERTRELGLLRAVGMSRRQTRTMVRWESVVISVLGGLLGLVVGVLFGALAVSALRDEGFEVLELPVLQLVLALVLSALAGIAAAVIPARRASRVDILQAIAAE